MENDDHLEELLVDKSEVDTKRLKKALKDRIKVDKETGDPVFLEFASLSNKSKVISYLLYRKVVRLLGILDSYSEAASSRTISEETGVNYNTVRSSLSKLDFVKSSDEGHYIPNYHLKKSLEAIE